MALLNFVWFGSLSQDHLRVFKLTFHSTQCWRQFVDALKFTGRELQGDWDPLRWSIFAAAVRSG